MGAVDVPVVGMTFCSPDEAYDFYKRYSCKVGFGITRRSTHNFYGIKYDVTFCCNKNRPPVTCTDEEGYRSRNRGNVGTGCRARIVVRDRMLNGSWCIEEVEVEHNHELRPDCVRLMRCHKNLPKFVKKQLEINECVGLAQNKSISAIFTQAGGVTKCMFTDRDMRNYVAEVRRLKLKGGDAAALMRYFRKQQSACPNFWYSHDCDDEGRLKNVFWADGRSRAAFNYFGDVVTFDSTYLTNRYRMPFAVFVGVNHHGQSILLGCALLANEFTETYEWVFRSFIQCMNGAPKAIITDQCGAICGAVREVFCETRHRLCLWHILKKLPEKLISIARRDEVMSAVSNAVYDTNSVKEFEQAWLSLMTDFKLGSSHAWFAHLYEIRAQWVPVFVKPYFWAGMSTTQRSEGMNAFFDGYVNSRTSLKSFVEKYDVALHCKWEKEKHEDFRSLNVRPRLVSCFGFERQFAAAYTLKMFYTFQKEVKQMMYCNCEVVAVRDSVKDYRVSESPSDKCFTVKYMVDTCEFYCDCMMFQFRGVVCRHALCSYRVEGVDVLPAKYVISRWRKDFVRSHVDEIVSLADSVQDIGRYDVLYSKVNSLTVNMVELGCRDKSIAELLVTGMAKLSRELIEKSRSYNGAVDLSEGNFDDISPTELDCSPSDPLVSRSKGWPRNSRLFKSASEKMIGKKRCKATAGNSSGKKCVVSKARNATDCNFNGGVGQVNPDCADELNSESVLSATELLMHFSSCVH